MKSVKAVVLVFHSSTSFFFFFGLNLTLLHDAIKNNRTFYNEAISTVNAPSMIWFSKDGRLAFVGSQKESVMDVIDTTSKKSIAVVNLTKADPIGFTPFVKVTPDGSEVWLVHKSADAITVISTQQPFNIISTIKLEKGSKPNHVEFAGGREDNGGRGYAYVTLADADPKTNTSKVMIIDTICVNARCYGCFICRCI